MRFPKLGNLRRITMNPPQESILVIKRNLVRRIFVMLSENETPHTLIVGQRESYENALRLCVRFFAPLRMTERYILFP